MTTTTNDAVIDFLTPHLVAESFRYAVGRQMFCPACDQCLDWLSAVEIDVYGVTTGKLHWAKVLCAKCADAHLIGFDGRLASEATKKAGEPLRFEVIDGRDWNEEGDFDPAPKSEQGPAVSFRAARRDNPEGALVSGFEVSCLPPWARFICYPMPEGKLWHCCEYSTGYGFARGDSYKSAVIAGWRSLKAAGEEKFRKSVASVPALNS